MRFATRSIKAKASIIETRDIVNSTFITQILMLLLKIIEFFVDVLKLRKRVRDDVNIENAELFWRRLSFWLIFRVAIQRHLCIILRNETEQMCYKFFICTMLVQFFDDCYDQLASKLTITLIFKLCRRLAKLEMNKVWVNSVFVVYKNFFDLIDFHFKEIIKKATKHIEIIWSNYKKTIARKILKLSFRANEQALRLFFSNNEKYFFDILTLPRAKRSNFVFLKVFSINDEVIKQFQNFTNGYFNLIELKKKIEMKQKVISELSADCQIRTVELTRSIDTLFIAVKSAYDANSEQMSIFILNLFDLWVQMNKCIVKTCSFLKSYHSTFNFEFLNVIHLFTLSNMQRFRDIQVHLKNKLRNCRFFKTIFNEFEKTCFAAQYLEQSISLQNLRQQIEIALTRSREKKKIEWINVCEKYDKLNQEIFIDICVCFVNLDEFRNIQKCKKCWQRRCRRKMKIEIHENFFFEDYFLAIAIIFEFKISTYLIAYRNVTWRIIDDFAHSSKLTACLSSIMLLKDYRQLNNYLKSIVKDISFAFVKKFFLQTHFEALKMKVNLSDICFSHELKFSYYDTNFKIWLKSFDKSLTFQHHFEIHVSRNLQFSIISSSTHPASNINESSFYEIIVSQTKCSSNMFIHEFTFYQRLLSSKIRRWSIMLIKLSASNLNFSTKDIMHVFNQFVVQAGSAQNELDILRNIHLIFRDQSFCQRLMKQIRNRFRNIIFNWRETHCMKTLIIFNLRLFALIFDQNCLFAKSLFKVVREIVLQWIFRLRDEFKKANEIDAATRFVKYEICAALLCRRIFIIFIESNFKMIANDMLSFVQASMTLQENLVINIKKLPQNLKNMLIKNIKMTYRIQSIIRQIIEFNFDCLRHAIDKNWYDSENLVQKIYSFWCFFSSSNNKWVVSIIINKTNKSSISQVIHYNFVEENLLVNEKTLNVLFKFIKESKNIKKLFENQHFLTFSSSFEGMSHFLTTFISEHQIHVDFREKNVIIQIFIWNDLLE